MGWRERWGGRGEDGDRVGMGSIRNGEGGEDKDEGGNRDGERRGGGGTRTHLSSISLKMRGSRRRRSGTVRTRTKGSAREAGLTFTPHSSASMRICVRVKMCIRHVFTCSTEGGQRGAASHPQAAGGARSPAGRGLPRNAAVSPG